MVLKYNSLTIGNIAELDFALKEIDLSDLEHIEINGYLDSSGIGRLIKISKDKFTNTGEKLKLKGLSETQRKVFTLSKLDLVFNYIK